MIDTQKDEEYYIHIFLHTLIYFLIIYCFYYIIEYVRYEDLINGETSKVLDNKDIYKAFTLKNADKNTIDVIKNVNKANEWNNTYYYPLIVNILIFIVGIVCIMLASKIYWKQFKRIAYESVLTGFYLLIIRSAFNINVAFLYDNISEKEIYNNIIYEINKIIK